MRKKAIMRSKKQAATRQQLPTAASSKQQTTSHEVRERKAREEPANKTRQGVFAWLSLSARRQEKEDEGQGQGPRYEKAREKAKPKGHKRRAQGQPEKKQKNEKPGFAPHPDNRLDTSYDQPRPGDSNHRLPPSDYRQATTAKPRPDDTRQLPHGTPSQEEGGGREHRDPLGGKTLSAARPSRRQAKHPPPAATSQKHRADNRLVLWRLVLWRVLNALSWALNTSSLEGLYPPRRVDTAQHFLLRTSWTS